MSEREFEAYLNLLARTLRLSGTQRDRIAGELRDHMEARLDELIDQGVDRDDAVLQALDEFGDANVLADDLARPRHQLTRRRLMQTSLATVAAAAFAALAVVYLTPVNRQGVPPQPQAKAETQVDALPASLAAYAYRLEGEANKEGVVYVLAPGLRNLESGAIPLVVQEGDNARPITVREALVSAGVDFASLYDQSAPSIDFYMRRQIIPGDPSQEIQIRQRLQIALLPDRGIGNMPLRSDDVLFVFPNGFMAELGMPAPSFILE